MKFLLYALWVMFGGMVIVSIYYPEDFGEYDTILLLIAANTYYLIARQE